MRTKERITLSDTPVSAITKMSEGNPGAATVLTRVMLDGSKIDPDAGHGQSIFILLGFDSRGIFGSRVWMLYKDVCRERLDHTIAMVRAVQLGILPEKVLDHAIDNRGQGLDVADICAQVKERLPNFNFIEEPQQNPVEPAPV